MCMHAFPLLGAQGSSSSALAGLQRLGLASGPDMELLMQTLWPGNKQSLTARLGTSQDHPALQVSARACVYMYLCEYGVCMRCIPLNSLFLILRRSCFF